MRTHSSSSLPAAAAATTAHAPPDCARRVDRVAERWISGLHSQIPQHPLVGLQLLSIYLISEADVPDGKSYLCTAVSSFVVHKRFWSSNYVSLRKLLRNVIGAPETFVDD